MHGNILSLILSAGPVVKFVMLVLVFFSVVSWAIILMKWGQLRSAERDNALFMDEFREDRDRSVLVNTAKRRLASPNAALFLAAVEESGHFRSREEVARIIRRYSALESARLERHLSFLATTGSSTPFIGLFGTVWGIMTSFMSIGQAGAASLAVVAPGIAEALIATAMGLVAAIPAVIAYNYYLSRSRLVIIEMDDFAEELADYFTRPRNEG